MAQPGERGTPHDAQLRSEAEIDMPGTVGLWQRIWSRPTNSSLASGGDLVYQERYHHRRHDHRLVQFFYLKKVGTRKKFSTGLNFVPAVLVIILVPASILYLGYVINFN